jgi:hypothetical protein
MVASNLLQVLDGLHIRIRVFGGEAKESAGYRMDQWPSVKQPKPGVSWRWSQWWCAGPGEPHSHGSCAAQRS